MNDTTERSAHVRSGSALRARVVSGGHLFTPDAATDPGGIPVLSSPLVPDGRWLWTVDPGTGAATVFVGEHDEQAAEVISAELVACTLGVRRRPELVMGPGERARASLERFSVEVSAAMQRAGESAARAGERVAKRLAGITQATR